MKIIFLGAIAAFAVLTSCGDSNHYDTHKGQEAESTHAGSGPDTIMGRAPDSTNVVTDSSNIGIGDTSLERTPH